MSQPDLSNFHRTHRITLDVTINAASTDIETVELKSDMNIRNVMERKILEKEVNSLIGYVKQNYSDLLLKERLHELIDLARKTK